MKRHLLTVALAIVALGGAVASTAHRVEPNPVYLQVETGPCPEILECTTLFENQPLCGEEGVYVDENCDPIVGNAYERITN